MLLANQGRQDHYIVTLLIPAKLWKSKCKVIRIGKRVQPDISKARQQVNIDRPAYTKTDKQCRTRTTITARFTRRLSTAFKDKHTTYDRHVTANQ